MNIKAKIIFLTFCNLLLILSLVLEAKELFAQSQNRTAHFVWVVAEPDYRNHYHDAVNYLVHTLPRMQIDSCCWRGDHLEIGIADYNPLGGLESVIEALERTLMRKLEEISSSHEFASVTIIGIGAGALWAKQAFLRERVPGGRLWFNRAWSGNGASVGDSYLWLNPLRDPLAVRSDVRLPSKLWPSFSEILRGSAAFRQFENESLNFHTIGAPWESRCQYREPPNVNNILGCGAEYTLELTNADFPNTGRNPFYGFSDTEPNSKFLQRKNQDLRNEALGMTLISFAAGSMCTRTEGCFNVFTPGNGQNSQWNCLPPNNCRWRMPPNSSGISTPPITPIGNTGGGGNGGQHPPQPPHECRPYPIDRCGGQGAPACPGDPAACKPRETAVGVCNKHCNCDTECRPETKEVEG